MQPHMMDVVVEGKRYPTSAATLLASGPNWDERLGWQGFLFRTPKGNHFVQFQSTWPGERDRLFPLSQDEAMRLYGELPEKKVSFEGAFPGVEIEEA